MIKIKVAGNSICLIMTSECKEINQSALFLILEKDCVLSAQFQREGSLQKDCTWGQVLLITSVPSARFRLEEGKSIQ